MKRFYVAMATSDGGVELHPMKAWLREHPADVPPGFDPTTSTSHQLRGALRKQGWGVEESDSEVRLFRPGETVQPIGPGIDDGDGDEGTEGRDPAFGLEYQLRDFLAQNLEQIQINGETLRVYVDPTGRDGVEFPTDVGPIDILARAPHGAFVVFELKRARVADRAVGQLARYMGWVKHTIGRDQPVRGVIVAKRIDSRLRYAAAIVPGVTLLEYSVEFHLHPAHELPISRYGTSGAEAT